MFDPEHIGPTCVNVGIMVGSFISIVIVVKTEHCPGAGVNVYVVVSVLFNSGAHEPYIPLFESTGRGLRTAPEHIGSTCVNVGVTLGVVITLIVIVAEVAHCPS